MLMHKKRVSCLANKDYLLPSANKLGHREAQERLHDDIRQQLEESKLAELDIDGEYQDWLY